MKSTVEENDIEAQAEHDETNSITDIGADETTAQLAEAQEKLAYLAADFENFKRQASRRENEARERASRTVLEQMLPVLDNFNLALLHAGTAKDVASLKIGLEFVAQQLETALRGAGLEPIDSKGEKFDPARHDAIEEIASPGVEPGTVVEETQRGYVYKGQILRPSRVRVAS